MSTSKGKKVKNEPINEDDDKEALALMTTQEELPQVAGVVDDSRWDMIQICSCDFLCKTPYLPVAPLPWVCWVPGNPSIFEQWVPEPINF